jgi:hypothetical protein
MWKQGFKAKSDSKQKFEITKAASPKNTVKNNQERVLIEKKEEPNYFNDP